MTSVNFANGNCHFVEQEYKLAIECYDKAIAEDPKNAAYYNARAAVYCQEKEWKNALQDADKSIELDKSISSAFFRKGQAHFFLSDYKLANAAFSRAQMLGNTKSQLWRRKCDAELALQEKNKQESSSLGSKSSESSSSTSKLPSSSSTSKLPSSSTLSDAVNIAAQDAEALVNQKPLTLADKVTFSWYQDKDNVNLTIFAKKLKAEDVNITTKNKNNTESVDAIQKIAVQLTMPDSSIYTYDFSLFEHVKKIRYSTTAYKVEIVLEKMISGQQWDTLELIVKPSLSNANVQKRDNIIHNDAKPVYPSSAQGGKKADFTAIEEFAKKDEEEEKPEGQDALNKLFQQIYSGGTDETKKAMMKSFQTSGGTVLSTNWGEVKEKDYEKEIEPPKGMEVKKWEY